MVLASAIRVNLGTCSQASPTTSLGHSWFAGSTTICWATSLQFDGRFQSSQGQRMSQKSPTPVSHYVQLACCMHCRSSAACSSHPVWKEPSSLVFMFIYLFVVLSGGTILCNIVYIYIYYTYMNICDLDRVHICYYILCIYVCV